MRCPCTNTDRSGSNSPRSTSSTVALRSVMNCSCVTSSPPLLDYRASELQSLQVPTFGLPQLPVQRSPFVRPMLSPSPSTMGYLTLYHEEGNMVEMARYVLSF